jgi:hypothetical protein
VGVLTWKRLAALILIHPSSSKKTKKYIIFITFISLQGLKNNVGPTLLFIVKEQLRDLRLKRTRPVCRSYLNK